MKKILFIISMIFAFILQSTAQKIIIDNDKIKVIEYNSEPSEGVCGKGLHYHPPHLTVLLTDAYVQNTQNGKTEKQHAPAGTIFWSKATEHIAINAGTKPIRLYIIEPKNGANITDLNATSFLCDKKLSLQTVLPHTEK